MANDYYSAQDSNASPGDGGDVKPSKPQGDDEGDDLEGDSALVPKSLFRGKVPDVGEDCTFRVEHIFEDEVELSWSDKDGGDKKPRGTKDKASMDTAMDSFDKMSGPASDEE